ncbi:expressed protein [Phakopsora pachyrhizi]|uniref:Expressed protein n=1 Tax=Phakopsora pachyrhizi TaxID=170000 RepID=A0AAV0BR75_PHAPC|nr:expressed protein [Phakopsora pachyrhizi]
MIHKHLIDQTSNSEDAMKSCHQNPWNSAPVDHLSLSGKPHQKHTYPHLGFSQDQGTSSNTIQPMYDTDVFGGNHINLVPNIDDFRYPDSSFVPQPHHNFEIPHDEQMTQHLAFHSTQNDLSNIHHLSDIRNRVYQNQDWGVLDFNPTSSSHNYGFVNTGAAIDYGSNLVDNENLIFGASKKSMSKEAQPTGGAKNKFTDKEKSELIRILKNDFRISPRGIMSFKSKGNDVWDPESIHKKGADLIKKYKSKGVEAKLRAEQLFAKAIGSKINRLRKFMIFEYTLDIEWKGSESFKLEIYEFSVKFKKHGNLDISRSTLNHMNRINVIGITFMKIISRKYWNDPVSERFGNDSSILHYTESFWNCCFRNDRVTNNVLRNFFKSLGKDCPEEDIDRFLSTRFLHRHNTPEIIFSRIKKSITGKTETKVTFMYSWYFVFFRAMVYYPHLVFDESYFSGNQLKNFVENGIIHIFDPVKKVQ